MCREVIQTIESYSEGHIVSYNPKAKVPIQTFPRSRMNEAISVSSWVIFSVKIEFKATEKYQVVSLDGVGAIPIPNRAIFTWEGPEKWS